MELKAIRDAQERLKPVLNKYSTLERQAYFSDIAGGEVYLKFENRQKTGSFKVRGAYNKISKMASEGSLTSVVAASAGNHAQGVAFGARENGVTATIVMPKSTPLVKVLATEGYGAEVVLHGDFFDDARDHALELAKQTGATFLEPFNDLDVIAGQGTLGIEIIEELENVDIIVVPCGGGGLLAGIAVAVKSINPKVKVIGVQAEKADAMVKSFQNGKITNLGKIKTIADGIAVKKPGDIAFNLIQKYVDDMVTVCDDEIASTILELMERTKQIVEPAGAASLTAVIHGKIDAKGKTCACILSGGNVDIGMIHKIIERGLTKRERKVSLSILLQDIPGTLEKVASCFSRANANITRTMYDSNTCGMEMGELVIHVSCDVSGSEHKNRIVNELEENGFKVIGGK